MGGKGTTDVGSTNLSCRGSYSGAERLCGSRTDCSVFAYGDQCIRRAAAYNHVRSAGDIAARTCRGT